MVVLEVGDLSWIRSVPAFVVSGDSVILVRVGSHVFALGCRPGISAIRTPDCTEEFRVFGAPRCRAVANLVIARTRGISYEGLLRLCELVGSTTPLVPPVLTYEGEPYLCDWSHTVDRVRDRLPSIDMEDDSVDWPDLRIDLLHDLLQAHDHAARSSLGLDPYGEETLALRQHALARAGLRKAIAYARAAMKC